MSHHHLPAVTWVLDELEGNQKKENHLNTMSKMIGTLVQVKLYTLVTGRLSKKPSKIAKKSPIGGKTGQN